MKKFKLNLWSSDEKKKQPADSRPDSSAVIDGVDGESGGHHHGGKMFFGIKSYLHQFYLASPTSGNPFIDDAEPAVMRGGSGAWYLLPPPPSQRMGLYVCRLLTVIGLLLLLGGATGIIVGYCWPGVHHWGAGNSIETSLMRIAIDQDEEGNFYIPPERFTEFLRDPMHKWKITGFCVFAMGASLMALGLLVPTCAQCLGGGSGRMAAFASEDNTPNEPPIRIYPAAGTKFRVVPAKYTGGHKISPTSGPVPVMEEIAKVQPGSKKGSVSPSPSADDLLLGSPNNNDSQPLLHR